MNRLALGFIGILSLVGCNSRNTSKEANGANALNYVYQKNLQDSTLATGWYYIENKNNGFGRQLEKTEEIYFVNPRPIVIAANFKEITLEKNKWDEPFLLIPLDKTGTQAWAEATSKAAGSQLGLIVNNRLLYAPHINSQVTGGATVLNSADYTTEEYQEIKKEIEK